MGKPLSRPGCLRRSPCCSRRGEDGDAYNEDGYIPQRSIYDTMCINEQIDHHGSAHSTLGRSRGGQDATFPINGSLGVGMGDLFEPRSSLVITSGRKIDERFIFDSLKLANDGQSRSPGGFVKSVSPSVSCSSAPGGGASMTKRHHQDSGKKENLCRHSWKVISPPKFPEPLELSPGEKHLLNPGTAFFPNSITSPQISPFSGSPLSSGAQTPPVFFSPARPLSAGPDTPSVFFSPAKPLIYQQEFHRQSLPIQFQPPPLQRPPLLELSVSALPCGHGISGQRERMQAKRMDEEVISMAKDREEIFGMVGTKPMDSGSEQDSPAPEPDHDTAPLLHAQIPPGPAISPAPMESTWPRRLIGRRRTVRQGGALHNLPILPPLPYLLKRSATDKKTLPRLSPFPEHQGNLEGQLGRSQLAGELGRSPLKQLKDCSLLDWKILRELEERKAGPSGNESGREQESERHDKMAPVKEGDEQSAEEETSPDLEVENWEAVLEMVNTLWDEAWKDSDSQHTGSLRNWPLLHPPSGFGGSQDPSCTTSEVGAEDLLELERMNKAVLDEPLEAELPNLPISQASVQQEDRVDVIVAQPTGRYHDQTRTPTSLDLNAVGVHTEATQWKENKLYDSPSIIKAGYSGSPDSNLTLESDSSGIYMSKSSATSREDIASDGDRPMSDLGLGSATSLDQVEEERSQDWNKKRAQKIRQCSPTLCAPDIKISHLDCQGGMPTLGDKKEASPRNRVTTQSSTFRDSKKELDRGAEKRDMTSRGTVLEDDSRPVDEIPVKQGNQTTTVTSRTDSPLPLSPSKHEVQGTVLDTNDMDPFVATDSFVYLAVSVLPPVGQEGESPSVPPESSHSNPFSKPCSNLDECDFLSTDSFVYLAAPDCYFLVTEGHSVCADSKDSDSDDSESRVDFVLGSMVGDSDWDSDLSDYEPDPESDTPAWDHWDELEPGVLPGLFCDGQSETELFPDGQAQQIGRQLGELASEVTAPQKGAEQEAASEGAEPHTEVKSVS